jgi:DNA-binding CsgD family transcriptional regulator
LGLINDRSHPIFLGIRSSGAELSPPVSRCGNVAAVTRARVRDDIVRLLHRTTDAHRLARDMTRILERAVPFDGVGMLTFDPATLLPTGEVVDARLGVSDDVVSETWPRFIEIELGEPDFNKFHALARQRRRAASLSDATQGNLQKSVRYRELCQSIGFNDEVRVVCSDSAGTWGALTLARESGRPSFKASEVSFLGSLAPLLAEGLRRAAILGDVATGNQHGAGVVVLSPDNSMDSATAGAEHLLADLKDGDRPAAELPVVVLSVAARARNIAIEYQDEPGFDTFARARVRTAQGNWLTVRGSVLGDGPDSSVAVLIDETQPAELAPLIADAYGLTDRERGVTELVAKGFSTNDIGQALHLSAYTVQDHLKSIYDKTGAGSRGELVARLFFDHYAPRLQIPEADSAVSGVVSW